jgi:hypothetical protein
MESPWDGFSQAELMVVELAVLGIVVVVVVG